MARNRSGMWVGQGCSFCRDILKEIVFYSGINCTILGILMFSSETTINRSFIEFHRSLLQNCFLSHPHITMTRYKLPISEFDP